MKNQHKNVTMRYKDYSQHGGEYVLEVIGLSWDVKGDLVELYNDVSLDSLFLIVPIKNLISIEIG